jgi:hypothetical protein
MCSAIFATANVPKVRPSKVPVEIRRQAVVPRSQPGPVMEVMLKNWPKDRIVAEIVALHSAHEKAERDHDKVALDVVDREIAKIAGLCEQHELKDPGFTQRVWDHVDELTGHTKAEPVNKDLLNVIHGSAEPGTLGAELTDELRQALMQIATPTSDVAQGVATPTAPVAESADDIVNRAMNELANNQESSI